MAGAGLGNRAGILATARAASGSGPDGESARIDGPGVRRPAGHPTPSQSKSSLLCRARLSSVLAGPVRGDRFKSCVHRRPEDSDSESARVESPRSPPEPQQAPHVTARPGLIGHDPDRAGPGRAENTSRWHGLAVGWSGAWRVPPRGTPRVRGSLGRQPEERWQALCSEIRPVVSQPNLVASLWLGLRPPLRRA